MLEEKNMISVEVGVGQDSNGKDIFEPTFVPCEVGNADWDAIQIRNTINYCRLEISLNNIIGKNNGSNYYRKI